MAMAIRNTRLPSVLAADLALFNIVGAVIVEYFSYEFLIRHEKTFAGSINCDSATI
jgi:hypothetical protein